MSVAALIGQVILGWMLADFLSGIFHWIQDRLIPEDMPFFGAYLAAHARLHHVKPLAFTEGSFLYRNGATYVLAGIISAPLVLVFGPSVFLASLTIGGAVSTQIHLWSHRPSEAPTIIQLLQETGLVQSAKQHSRHHRPPMTSHYCLLTDILNPILEQVNFWTAIERLMSRCGIAIQGTKYVLPHAA